MVRYSTGGRSVGDLPGHSVVGGQVFIGRDWLKKDYVCSAENEYGTQSVNLAGMECECVCVCVCVC